MGHEVVANGSPASPSASRVGEVVCDVGSPPRHTRWDTSQASWKSLERLPAFSTHIAPGGPPGGFAVTTPPGVLVTPTGFPDFVRRGSCLTIPRPLQSMFQNSALIIPSGNTEGAPPGGGAGLPGSRRLSVPLGGRAQRLLPHAC